MLRDRYIKAGNGGGSGAVLPPGTYTPVNSISGPFDLLWEGATANVSTDFGSIEKTSGAGLWDGSAYATIPHTGDFTLEFQFDFSLGATDDQFGLSYYKSRNSFENLDFSIYRTGATAVQVWENGANKGADTLVSDTDILSIERSGFQVFYKVNSTIIRTIDILNTGPMNIDCSLFDLAIVKNIQVIIP